MYYFSPKASGTTIDVKLAYDTTAAAGNDYNLSNPKFKVIAIRG